MSTLLEKKLLRKFPNYLDRTNLDESVATYIANIIGALNELVHANEDLIDNYTHIQEACKKAKMFLPDYSEKPMFTDYT